MYLIVLVSCTTDSPSELQAPVISGGNTGGSGNTGGNYATNPFFGFLDGDGSSSTYIIMPIESSSTNLIISRWKIIKEGVDENNDGNIKYYNYLDYKHNEYGLSFLQFNNNGVVFENAYYNDNGTCILYSERVNWELLENNRIKIYVYNNIYLVKVTQSELILKYEWNFANSLYGPAQVYYHYERIVVED
ncbi:hypothetical protein ACFX5E_14250 [Flavobacterium sp. LS2P90]|uniref:Lipocalin-like domain-containing protein n=1 Tax=Flavobacterium xylosi TaxID=3230415 RepID=A0ABW6HZ60_9FLAO